MRAVTIRSLFVRWSLMMIMRGGWGLYYHFELYEATKRFWAPMNSLLVDNILFWSRKVLNFMGSSQENSHSSLSHHLLDFLFISKNQKFKLEFRFFSQSTCQKLLPSCLVVSISMIICQKVVIVVFWHTFISRSGQNSSK